MNKPVYLSLSMLEISRMNKLVYLGLSTLEISKTLTCEFWYDYIKPKYQYDAKLCYIATGSFTIHINPYLTPLPCTFPQNVSSRERMKPSFFVSSLSYDNFL